MITSFMTLKRYCHIKRPPFLSLTFFQNKGQSIMSWDGWNWQHRQGDSWDVGDTFVGTRLFWNCERILVHNKYIWWCIYILNLNMIIYNKICFDGYKICTNEQETQNKLCFWKGNNMSCVKHMFLFSHTHIQHQCYFHQQSYS